MSDPEAQPVVRERSREPMSGLRNEALDELIRPGPERSARWGRTVASLPTWVLTVAVVIAGVVGLVVWNAIRRPGPVAGSLPHAGNRSDIAASVRTSTTAVNGKTSGSRPGAAADGDPGALGTGGAAGATVTVHVAGAVLHPGVVTLRTGARAVDAVAAAGGLASGADPDRVNLAAPMRDGDRLAIPILGQPPPEAIPATGNSTGGTGSPPGAPAGPVDINTASTEMLDTLPGVGPSTAAAIVAHRERSGRFRNVEGLLEVRGIGDAKLEAIRDLVTVGGG